MKRFTFFASFFLYTANAPAQNVMVSGSGPMLTTSMPGPINQLDFLTNYLNLSSSQAEQAKPLFDAERDSITKLFDSMKKAHEALAAAEKSDQADSEIDQFGGALGVVQGQLAAIHSKTMVHFHALLTTDQRDKLDKFPGPSMAMGMGFAVSAGPAPGK